MALPQAAAGVDAEPSGVDGLDEALPPGALALVATLQRRLGATRERLLSAREARQAELDAGASLDFPAETRELRASEWTAAAPPPGRLDRRAADHRAPDPNKNIHPP